MVREISTDHAPSLRRAIERDKIIQDRNEWIAERKRKPLANKENPLVVMMIIALRQACEKLGVKYWQ